MKWSRVPLVLLVLCAARMHATHIIGGEIYYDHLGANQYRIFMDLYRDCSSANANGTGFDVQVQVGVFNSAGTFLFSQTLNDPGELQVPVVITNPCLTAPPDVCISTTRYQGIFNLPPIAGGYRISYQRCCRTPAIVNLMNAGQQGLTCTVQVPPTPNQANSAPRFNAYPPVVLCLDEDLVIDQSATDPDGDQLVYELFTPLHGASAADPAPPPAPPPYTPVPWAAGYSVANQVNSTPPMAIDPVTGQLTIHPTQQGNYAVGVLVKEFRNGTLLSEVRRDFMFKVVPCDPNIIATVSAQTPAQICVGLTQSFGNESINGLFWHWNFGEPTTLADTSNAQIPSWTYAQPGTYTVTLIANPGWPCADTSAAEYQVQLPLIPVFATPAALCGASEVSLQATGNFTSAAGVTWDLGVGAATTTAQGAQVTTVFQPLGDQPVTVSVSENGCTGQFTGTVGVFPIPVAGIQEQQVFCTGLTVPFVNTSTGATSYAWDLGESNTGMDVSDQASPTWTYSQQGTYTVTLVVDPIGPCPVTTSAVFEVYEDITASFIRPAIRCPNEDATFVATGNFSPAAQIQWDLGDAGVPGQATGNPVNARFLPVGAHPVILTVSENGCVGTYIDSVLVFPFPVADFESDSRSCVGSAFSFTDNSTAWTTLYYDWSFGDGGTASGPAPVHVYTEPGLYTVTLTVVADSGCTAMNTTVRPGQVEVFSNPVAGFSALPREVSVFDPKIEVTDGAIDAVVWTYWIDGQLAFEPSFTFLFQDGGQYPIWQVVENEHGCRDSTMLMVIVSDHLFYAPNAFTPDGDGINDTWSPMVLGARHYELEIYDRWGAVRFRTTDAKQGWDGEGLPQGVFTYRAWLKEWGALSKEFRGHFTLVR